MLLNLPQLKDLVAKLEGARRDATQGSAGYCTARNTNDLGETYRWEPKPRAGMGGTLRDGTKVEAMPDGQPGIRVPLGPHGRAFLAIDPATGDVRCAKCAEGKA